MNDMNSLDTIARTLTSCSSELNRCTADLEACEIVRNITSEPYADIQLEALASLMEMIAPKIHDKPTSNELAEHARFLRGSYIPQLLQDRTAAEENGRER